MSGMYGADVAQLRQLAGHFSSAADRLDADRMTVGNAIRIQAWFGPVAVRFRAQWDSEHSVKLKVAAARLRDAAAALRRNADEQERASAVDSGRGFAGAGGGGGGGPLPPGLIATTLPVPIPWLRLFDLPGLVRLIRGGTVFGIPAWDAISAVVKGLKWADIGKVPGFSKLGLGMSMVTWLDRIAQGTFNGHDAADIVSRILKSTKNPVLAIAGVGVKAGSEAVAGFIAADFGAEQWERNMRYIQQNPGALLEELYKAGVKAISWLP
ncbi:hypothetical protein [Microbacterium album]|uniref:Uncharacterized protein n=1 Tax=Microbacterium album TaxID=2053191 RepID=A0A917IDL9_9MICO|nr:hypothetical protein [Microbacterium album]GGH42225.1 hypothetical protein GCM10010921_15310 [Microbacterium album]